jgi:hypothetical protein
VVSPAPQVKLTAFQQSCVDDLAALAADLGGTIDRKDVVGARESYVVLDLTTTEGATVTAWVYEDEAMLETVERSYYFEKPDYKCAADLLSALVAATSSVMAGKEPIDAGSSRVDLFRGRRL